MTRASNLADYARIASIVENFSMPTARAPLVIYVMSGGSDTYTPDQISTKGQSVGTAFATANAALNFAKTFATFTGRLSTLELRFGPGSWGFFSLGSNLEQAQDVYPFAIHVTCQDDDDWPRFNALTNGGFAGSQLLYISRVEMGYCTALRRNTTIVQHVRVWNYAPVGQAFLANVGGVLYLFGPPTAQGPGGCEVLEPCTYSVAFFYAAFDSYISIENGDVPATFPLFTLTGQANITSPFKFRAVLNSTIWAGSEIYPQLTYADTFFADRTSAFAGTNPNSENSSTFRGGNSNGEFVVYPDGFAVCKHLLPAQSVSTASGNGFITTATTTWVFPVTNFIAAPVVTGCVPGASVRWVTASVTATQAGVRQNAWVSSATELPAKVTATGFVYARP
jgi:hypothetical protein